MIRKILLIISVVFISSCADNPIKISNKGGILSPDQKYEFNILMIDNIKATNNASEANYCVPLQRVCWRLWYPGDLSDYENGDYVNISVEKGKVTDIGSVWFPTTIAYGFGNIFFGHYGSVIFAKTVGAPLILIFIILFIIGLLAPEKKKKEEDN